MFEKMVEARAELNILCNVSESLQQSKSVENFGAGNIFPLKCELVIQKCEGKVWIRHLEIMWYLHAVISNELK